MDLSERQQWERMRTMGVLQRIDKSGPVEIRLRPQTPSSPAIRQRRVAIAALVLGVLSGGTYLLSSDDQPPARPQATQPTYTADVALTDAIPAPTKKPRF